MQRATSGSACSEMDTLAFPLQNMSDCSIMPALWSSALTPQRSPSWILSIDRKCGMLRISTAIFFKEFKHFFFIKNIF